MTATKAEAARRNGPDREAASGAEERIRIEASRRRVRTAFGDEVIADTTRPLLMLERGHLPVYYIPRTDVRTDRLRRSQHRTICPFKGEATYWSVVDGGREAENAVWAYENPLPGVAAIGGHLAFYWNKMDHWYEEDEEVFGHPRDPYHRVDVLFSSRPVRVVLGGETVAETKRARFLFETGMPTRYYVPREDVRTDLLVATETRSVCPYKGTARYWSARISGRHYEDIVWAYEDPIPECPKIKDLLCFYNERVDQILVDGRPEAAV